MTADHDPIPTFRGAPVYAPRQAPDHLHTLRQLGARRRRVLSDTKPAAWLNLPMPYRGADYVPLFDLKDSIGLRALSPAELRAMAARRTCEACETVFEQPVRGGFVESLRRWARWCRLCRSDDLDRHLRTCSRCRTLFEQRESVGYRGTCLACSEHLDRARAVVRALEDRSCPRCTVTTATAAEVAAARSAEKARAGYSWWPPRTCEPCTAAQAAEREEAERRAWRRRWAVVEPVRAWARELLADPATVILDTETTGLHDAARIVEIAVYSATGEKLLDRLVDPGEPIPEAASAIHRITDADVAGAPTFGELLPELTDVLAGRRIVIYNRAYDRARLAYELDRWHREMTPLHPPLILTQWDDHPAVVEWMQAQRWEECAMAQYAVYVGEWSDYFGDYRWQRLNGGHRAGGDCLAVADRLREIAAAPDPL
ncbi:3'-5' exonuclease [Kitasatospora sp. NPDC048722]|uniref:3'-5' exonuclease n=1 Tax=Kitasatospora sp. NPDC048722 TaxID=3155639 RepID=UPI0033FE0771